MATSREFGGRKTPFDCRVWIKMAASELTRVGVIQCSDYLMLEKECEKRAGETKSTGQVFISEYST